MLDLPCVLHSNASPRLLSDAKRRSCRPRTQLMAKGAREAIEAPGHQQVVVCFYGLFCNTALAKQNIIKRHRGGGRVKRFFLPCM